MGNEGIA